MHEQLLAEFIQTIRQDSAARNTVRTYTYSTRAYLLFLQSIDIAPCNATRDDILAHIAAERGKGSTPGALRSRLKAVKRFHRFLEESGRADSPLKARVRIPLPVRLPRYATIEDAARFLDSVSGDDALSIRDRALLELLYSTGLRASELCGLKLERFDRAARSIRLIGKGNAEAFVHYGEQAEAALARWLLVRDSFQPASDALWLNCFGGPLRYAGLHRMVRARSRAVGLDIRPHMLRHSFATHLMQRGAHLREIQELMRHASITSTQVYTHLDTTRAAEARRKYHPRG